MTTIAYKDGYIACDSRVTQGDMVFDDNATKKVDIDGVTFFFSGCVSDRAVLTGAYFGTGPKDGLGKITPCAFVLDSGKLFQCSIDDGEFWSMELDAGKYFVIGSGGRHAITAMDMGATAREAVKWAAKRDVGTGGKIRAYKVFKEVSK